MVTSVYVWKLFLLFAYVLILIKQAVGAFDKECTCSSFQGLIKALKMLNERYGKVYVDFAEPISVRDLFQFSGLKRSPPTPASPQVHHALSIDETAFSMEVAHHVVQQQQRHSVITAFNLMSVILNSSALEGTGPPLLNEMVANVSWFKSVMEVLGALIDIQGG